MNYLGILIYLFFFLTIAHSYVFSKRLSKFIIEPLFVNPYHTYLEHELEGIRIRRNNRLKLFFAFIFLIAPLYIYKSLFSVFNDYHIIFGSALTILIIISLALLWININKIGANDFGHKILQSKSTRTIPLEPFENKVHQAQIKILNETKNSLKKPTSVILLPATKQSEFKKVTKQSLKIRKHKAIIENHINLLEEFLSKLEGFKYFDSNSRNFNTLNITTLPSQKSPLSQERVCYAVLAFFFFEVIKNESYLTRTPKVFYKPLNKFMFNDEEIVEKGGFSKFRESHWKESGSDQFKNSDFYISLLEHIKKTPKR